MFDIVFGCVGLVISFPVIIVIAILVAIFLGRPFLFKQTRPGKHNKPFVIYKFRTMTDEKNEDGSLADDGVRLTPFGRFLRKTSLDELPEFWNVIKGDMSFVGPRPLLMEYVQLYSEEQARRGEVRPGITGWAQVKGRNAISWEDKFKLDVWYVDNMSMWLDIKILLMTIKTVLLRDGISHKNSATMAAFKGKKGR